MSASAHFIFIHVNLLAPLESPDTIPISEASILAHLMNHGFSGQILGDFAEPGGIPWVVPANRSLALFGIRDTTNVGLQRKRTEESLRDHVRFESRFLFELLDKGTGLRR